MSPASREPQHKQHEVHAIAWSATEENVAEKVLQNIAARHEVITPEEFQALAEETSFLAALLEEDVKLLPNKPISEKHNLVKKIQKNNRKLNKLLDALFEMSAKVDFQEAKAANLAAKESGQNE